jgi:predicted  nucleic acid-binding Zn-ribbon protein
MENLKDALKLLLALQDYDIEISKLNKAIANVDLLTEQENLKLTQAKQKLDEQKKAYVDINSLAKEKEADLTKKEESINKHTSELNLVKSNDAYKALLAEIEKARLDKSALEDSILEFLSDIDAQAAELKKAEIEFKNFEVEIKNNIDKIKKDGEAAKQKIKDIENQRQEQRQLVDKEVLKNYDRICEGKSTDPISVVENNTCSACGLVLRIQTLIDVEKCEHLVFCDGCSRILFKDE